MSQTQRTLLVTTVLAGGLLASASQAAVTGAVTFSGTVATNCAINVGSGLGTLAPNSTLTSLSSKHSGGQAALVEVTTTGGVRVSLDAVTSPTVPTADAGSITWVPTYSMSGAQTVAETGLPTLMTGSGTRVMNVHLTGTKAATDSFVGGTYSAVVTVRCE